MNPDKNNEFDRQLAGKFKDFRPEVPAGLWDKIATTLDKQDGGQAIPMKRRRGLPVRWLSIAAALLMVCGAVYWYNRPVTVTYLQNRIVQTEEVAAPAAEEPTQEPTPAVEPLDVQRLKRLFAKKNRKAENENRPEALLADSPREALPAETGDTQPLITDRSLASTAALAENTEAVVPLPTEEMAAGEELVATVPDIQPPVVLEEEEETLLAAVEEPRQPFGISNILNYVVGAVDQRDEKLVTFSNDDEGSLKLDFNFGLAKNKKKKIK